MNNDSYFAVMHERTEVVDTREVTELLYAFAARVKKGKKLYGQRSLCEGKIHFSVIPSCGELVNRSSKN